MATKTLTITEEAYHILADKKVENESFSEEIKRILTKKRRALTEFFGLMPESDGALMLKDILMIKSADIKLLKEKLK